MCINSITFIAIVLCANAQATKEGLIHYWTFDKDFIKGEVVTDRVGKNDGKITGDPKIVNGKIGSALEFNGNDYVSFTPVSALVDHSFTIQAWINLSKHANNTVISQGDAFSANRYLHFGEFGNTQAFMFRFYADDQDGGKLELNTWHHLLGVYDKDKKEATLYVDGEKVASKANCNGLKADPANSDLEIGTCYGRLGRQSWFNGIIDEVGIYDRVLSAEEVKQNYFSEKGLILSVNSSGKLSLTWGQIKVLR